MNEELFKNIEDLLGLKHNLKYQSAKRKYTDEKASRRQKTKAKTKLFSEIIKKYRLNEMLNTYLSESDKIQIEDMIENANTAPILTDNYFYTTLYLIDDKGKKATTSYTYDNVIIPSIKETALDLECNTVTNMLVDLDESTNLETKKSKITNALEELFLATKTEIARKDKTIYTSDKVQQKIEKIRNMMLEITLLINSEEDALEVAQAVDVFLASNENLIRKVDEKEMNEELMVKTTQEVKTNTATIDTKKEKNTQEVKTNTSKIDTKKEKNTSLVVRKPQNLSLQRVPVAAKITEPIKRNRIVSFILAGALGIGIFTGAYFLGKQSNKDEQTNTNTDITDNIKPETPEIEIPQDIISNALAEVEKDADIVYANWSQLQTPYTREEIVELMKCLRGLDSTITIEIADEMLLEMLNIAIYPGVNNAISGQEIYETNELDFSTLLSDSQRGIKAVENMEDYLNGCLTDQENIRDYATEAFEDQAFIVGEKSTIDGMSIAEDTITDPGVRLVWSRLAIGTNAIAGTLGHDFTVEINGKTYTQNDINNTNVLENIATTAKNDMGLQSQSLRMN